MVPVQDVVSEQGTDGGLRLLAKEVRAKLDEAVQLDFLADVSPVSLGSQPDKNHALLFEWTQFFLAAPFLTNSGLLPTLALEVVNDTRLI